MFAISLAVVIVQVVRCTLDPKTIPMFKTNLSIVFPVYRGKEIFSSSQLTENPQAFQTVLTTTPERKLKFTVTTKNVFQQILPAGFPKTEVYAYGGDCSDSLADQPLGQVFGWPGPAFRVPTQTKLEITWRNALKGAHMFQIERNLHFMHKVINFDNFIPTVAHIHGMPSQSKADGGPEGWFTSNGTQGSKYSTQNLPLLRNQSTISVCTQPTQATIFYHDHSVAMTRLNFYAGLSGIFLVEDELSPLSQVFDRRHDIILAIADRTFNVDGSFYYPSKGDTEEFPNWVPEFYGDVMTVNGKAYPNMNLERNRYRVRLLNACNSRALTISFRVEQTGALLPFLLYKSDSSYHYRPLLMSSLQLPVAARAEIVLDLTDTKVKKVIMQNIPLPTTAKNATIKTPAATSTDQVMSFTLSGSAAVQIAAPDPNSVLNPGLQIFPFYAFNLERRFYALYEIEDAHNNPLGVYINGVHMGIDNDLFELAKQYDLFFINLTPDTHPIHIHLVDFQHYKKASIDSKRYAADWKKRNGGEPPYKKAATVMLPDSYLTGKWMSLEGIDRSWRDVSNVEPGMVSVFRIRFKYTNGDAFPFEVRGGLFVMHCHILEHEDNDMMRYFSVA